MIVSREQMLQEYQLSMTRERGKRTSKEDEWDSHVVKSYLIEAHLPESAPLESARKALIELFGTSAKDDSSVRNTDDNDFFVVTHSGKSATVDFAFDIKNPRYWVAHTTGKSDVANKFIDRVIAKTTKLDHAWIPTILLDKARLFGTFRGFKFAYERHAKFNTARQSRSSDPLRMSLHDSPHAEWILTTLRGEERLNNQTALAKVKIKFGTSKADSTVVDISHDGKLAARGASAEKYIETVNRAYFDLYIPQIRTLEDKYAMSIESDSQDTIRVTGEPIYFRFDKPIDDIQSFCKFVFSATEPFRLWGLPQATGSKSFYVEAIDLHVGSMLRFELYSEYIRVFLPKHSCGNSILRLYTNLQHHFDAMVRVEDYNGGLIFVV